MTTYPRLIYNNFWRKGTALTASPTADPQHPVSDTQIDTMSMYFKASAKTTPSYIPMNFGAAKEIDFVAILAHNIDSDATITIEGATNAAFDAGLVSRTLTYNATNIFEFFTAFTKQYVRIKLVSGNGDFAAEPQIATILCGKYTEFNRRPQKGYTLGKEDITEIEETDSRVIFAQEKEPLNEYRYMFEALNNATEVVILAFLEECRINRGFVWCTNHAAANANSIFVRNTEIIYPVFQYPEVWSWEVAMREIV